MPHKVQNSRPGEGGKKFKDHATVNLKTGHGCFVFTVEPTVNVTEYKTSSLIHRTE